MTLKCVDFNVQEGSLDTLSAVPINEMTRLKRPQQRTLVLGMTFSTEKFGPMTKFYYFLMALSCVVGYMVGS